MGGSWNSRSVWRLAQGWQKSPQARGNLVLTLWPAGQDAEADNRGSEPNPEGPSSLLPSGTCSEMALLEFQGDLLGDVRAMAGLAVGLDGDTQSHHVTALQGDSPGGVGP